jgi:hypothetical protein
MKTPLIALLVLVTPAIARDGVDMQYAKSLLQRLEGDGFGYWLGINEQPEGGYIFRFEMDVTGDGRNEVFLASSLNGDHRSASWTVFTMKNGGWASSPEMILLNPSGIFVKTSSGTKCLALGGWARMSGSNYWINQYQFNPDGTFVKQGREVAVLTEEDRYELGSESWAEQKGLGRKVSPIVSKMLFAEYLTDPASQWRPYDPKLPANAQHQQDQERLRMDTVSGFTPENAAKLVAGFEPSPDIESGDASRHRTNIQPLAQPEKPKTSKAKPPAPSEEPASSTPWSVIVILIVAATGLLWLLVKKQK